MIYTDRKYKTIDVQMTDLVFNRPTFRVPFLEAYNISKFDNIKF